MSDELKKLQDAQTAQGEVVRKLKAEKADKASIDAEVKKLLDLKDQVTKKAAALGVTVEAPKPAAPAAKPAAKPAAAPAAKPAEKPKDAKKEAPKPAAAAPAEKKAEPKVAAPTPAAAPVAAPAPTPAAAAPAPSKATPQDVDVKYSPKQIPLALLVAIHHLEAQVRLKQLTPTADSLTFRFGKNAFDNEISALRFLARSFPETHLYGTPFNAFTSSEVDSWIGVALTLQSKVEPTLLAQLQSVLQLRTFLVEFNLTIADLTVWSALRAHNVNLKKDYPDVFRWFNFINTHTLVTSVLTRVTGEVETDKKKSRVGAQGSFTNLELPGAEMGKVVTRFPPEPSGYLHIGHIKAALLNNYYAQHFNGKLIIRFDDTNPAKEKDEYVEAILEDLHTLGISTKNVSYTSDFFDQLIVWAEKLISMGKGYIDDTPADQMKEERGEGVVSKRRNASVEDNMKLWNEMKQATELGKRCCLRAKIDMDSKNKCLRDPVFYRSVEQPHQRTKSKYKIYPTYDFACPIVDSLEGVTHALRSSEYHDRNALYNWVLETLKLRVVYIQDFSRLNFQYTVLSKRKLQWFVEQKMVSGWHDARFPTVRGILRRGMTVQALTEFILAQGASKTLTLMEPEKLWAINKKIIDPIVPRYMAVADGAVVLTLTNQTKSENKTVLKHRKQPELGTKVITLAPQLLIEAEDAAVVALNEEVTLMDIGNCFITKIDKDSTGKVTALTGKLHLEGDFKKTDKKLNWVAKGEDLVRVNMVDFDYLITKKKLDEEDKFEDFVNKNTKFDKFGYGDANLRSLKKGDQIQIERRGYFIVDEAYLNNTKPVVLFSIPDGHSTREASILVSKKPTAQSTTEEAKPAAPVATQTPAPAAKKEEKADELDLFGEDTEDEAREREIMKTAAEHAAKKKAAGKVAVLKSLVVIDVKPWDDTTDMKAMEEAVRSIVIEGLEWKASKLVAIGYGIKKLQISCHVVDEIVSVDDVQEKIQEFEDLVQSTDISSFSKL